VDGSNSAIFYLSILLYKNTILNVKKKMKKFIEKSKVYNEEKLYITDKL
jgi:hypothetical protein